MIATPPCQGMSVANHKKTEHEIERNSLVVESIRLIQKVLPRFFVFENVPTFMKTGCTAPDGSVKAIGDVIDQELSDAYILNPYSGHWRQQRDGGAYCAYRAVP